MDVLHKTNSDQWHHQSYKLNKLFYSQYSNNSNSSSNNNNNSSSNNNNNSSNNSSNNNSNNNNSNSKLNSNICLVMDKAFVDTFLDPL